MARRAVIINELSSGELVAELEQGGDIPEEVIEGELLSIIYKTDPALDNDTGRLVPGKKNSEISLSLHLTEPDLEGISRLGGIRGNEKLFHVVLQELKVIGYEVVDGRA